jgi:hypothetical protein
MKYLQKISVALSREEHWLFISFFIQTREYWLKIVTVQMILSQVTQKKWRGNLQIFNEKRRTTILEVAGSLGLPYGT